MNIREFNEEYDNLIKTRRQEGLKKIFDYILKDIDDNYGLITDILPIFTEAESEDYFGTEGLDV